MFRYRRVRWDWRLLMKIQKKAKNEEKDVDIIKKTGVKTGIQKILGR